jgi:ArsR family transcriptional regulator
MQAAADLFRALTHPMRLQILYRLLDSEVSVAGLETELGLRQPSLSQQLGHLREAGLVATRREAKTVWYSLADDRIRKTVEAVRAVLSDTPPPSELPSKQRRTVVASVKPEPSRQGQSVPLSRSKQAVECGVFAVVGWPVRDQS